MIENVRRPIFRRIELVPPQQPCDSIDWDFRFWAVNPMPTDEDALNAWKTVVVDAFDKPNQRGTLYEAARGFPPELKAWSWYDAAAADAESMRARDRNSAINHGCRADQLYARGGDVERIEAMFEEAISLDPTYALNYVRYARFVAHKLKDLDRAEELFERAIDADPKSADALGEYANFLEEDREDLEKAAMMRERALTADRKRRSHH
ncbi:tetratricopeptide repeat protein [Acidithrix ferrooxidans]|uniref:tetratricopeptide repeat protein n=1 Tax=Acidithrix ferrooxidans TaxID=1280514 RepID=UPI001269C8CB|nr:hypothetical protein [Acidithrix ferrooxidans]